MLAQVLAALAVRGGGIGLKLRHAHQAPRRTFPARQVALRKLHQVSRRGFAAIGRGQHAAQCYGFARTAAELIGAAVEPRHRIVSVQQRVNRGHVGQQFGQRRLRRVGIKRRVKHRVHGGA